MDHGTRRKAGGRSQEEIINTTNPKIHYFCDTIMKTVKNNLTPNFQPPTSYAGFPCAVFRDPCSENFYHPDHLGSSSWITDQTGEAIQHPQYLPFGEPWIDQRATGWHARHTFSGKERDEETGYSYFGARYYDSDLSIWLSVDPLADLYPHQSPYVYCSNNPINRIDPTGMSDGWVESTDGDIYWDPNATSQSTTKKGETYIGETVGYCEDGMLYKGDEQGNMTCTDQTVVVTAERRSGIDPQWLMIGNTESREPYSGLSGYLEYFWTGGIENGQKYNLAGEWIGIAPDMGNPPIPSFSGGNVIKLTKGASSILRNC